MFYSSKTCKESNAKLNWIREVYKTTRFNAVNYIEYLTSTRLSMTVSNEP